MTLRSILGGVLVAAWMALWAAAAQAETVPGDALRIIDGDTVALGRERIRLLGPDAPEIGHAHCPAERAAGLKAKATLGDLLRGQDVEIDRHGTDRYGRTLAALSVGGKAVGAVLEAEGLALVWSRGWRAHRKRTAHWCGPGEW